MGVLVRGRGLGGLGPLQRARAVPVEGQVRAREGRARLAGQVVGVAGGPCHVESETGGGLCAAGRRVEMGGRGRVRWRGRGVNCAAR